MTSKTPAGSTGVAFVAMALAWAIALSNAVFAAAPAASGPSAAPAPVSGSAPIILVFGDSISAAYGLAANQGWAALLQKRLTQPGSDLADYGYRVVNASVSGETTAGGRARLARALELHRPAILLLELGGNDGLRGLPVDKARENLDAMVAAAQSRGTTVLLLGMRMPTNYGPVYTRQFDAMYREVARRRRVPLVPFLLEGVALNPALMQADGIHPNALAQPRLLNLVWAELEPLLGRQ